MTLLKVENLTGGYSINKPVLHEVNLQVSAGQMVGLIGLNGAGKSTTIKHILGMMKPHSGSVTLHGKRLDEDPMAYRQTYAYVPESPLIYEELTVLEHMEMTAMSRNLSRADFQKQTEELLERFQMTKHQKKLSAYLSKGMKQKLMIMNAFLAKPDVYIIDEPFLGLDPLAMRSLLEKLDKERKEGAGILMSSHILSTIEKYGDQFIILDQGRVNASGTLSELRTLCGEPKAGLDRIFELRVLDGRVT
ncbi:ABC transporter ATP-binding protein [Marinicrinis sediminis]|uniref:ABC transporter ATP-binding protein n=1 Tax=Marinicrinis sediminis TaxID=1652465 RepID=A0ABW5R6G6_9BACL